MKGVSSIYPHFEIDALAFQRSLSVVGQILHADDRFSAWHVTYQ